MTRRQFLWVPSVSWIAGNRQTLTVPVHMVRDDQVNWNPGHVDRFPSLWRQAVRDLMRCGIHLAATQGVGGVWRPPHREPVITGLRRGAINLVITNEIPTRWSRGRVLCGVTTRYRGHHLCMIALDRAHGHQVPFFSVNTFLHELLHALLHDIFQDRPAGLLGEARELRIDFVATRLWLFHEGSGIRDAAQTYVERLRAESDRRAAVFPGLLRL